MSLRVYYEVLNQKGSPALFTDTLANRPAFGFQGRLFISTDTAQIFEDTGSAWSLIADATGSVIGFVPYSGAINDLNLGSFDITADIGIFNQVKAVGSGGLSINANSSTQVALFGAGGGANITFYGALTGTSATFSSSVTGSSLIKSGGTASQYLMADGSVTTLTNPVTGTGTTNTLPKFTGASTIGNSNITDNGTAIALNSDTAIGTTTLASGTKFTLGGSETAVSLIGRGQLINTTLVASANNDFLVGLDIAPTFTNGAFTGVTNYALRLNGSLAFSGQNFNIISNNINRLQYNGGIGYTISSGDSTTPIRFVVSGVEYFRLFGATGNVLLQNGGTYTDAGYRLDVTGTSRFQGTGNRPVTIDSNVNIKGDSGGWQLQYGFSGNSNTNRGGFGAVGSADSLTNYFIGVFGSEKMIITNTNGNVLIGTTTDEGTGYKLQVNAGTGQNFFVSSDGTNSIAVNNYSTASGLQQLKFRSSVFTIFTGTSGTAISTERLTIAADGVTKITNLAGTGSRTVLADSTGILSAPVSDISVKENISTIGYGLKEINKMNPVWFDYIDEYKNYGEGRQNGNIAQEMAEIIPEAVFTTPSTGKMGINYDQLHAVYIKAIQELNDKLVKNNIN